jgi:hypothetical protein
LYVWGQKRRQQAHLWSTKKQHNKQISSAFGTTTVPFRATTKLTTNHKSPQIQTRYKATQRIFFHNSGINQQPTKSTIKTLYTFQTTKSLKKFWIIPAAQRFFPKIIFLKNGAPVARMRAAGGAPESQSREKKILHNLPSRSKLH